jgi:hypothetical protein
MEVTRGFITIKTTNIRIKPTNLEIIGINVNNLVILKYLINDIPKYHQFFADRHINNYLFFELINKSPLWKIEFIINTSHFVHEFSITYILFINNISIIEHLNKSLALKFVISNMYSKLPEFINTDLSNKSFIPSNNPLMDIPVSKSDLESGNFKVDICHKNELGNDVIIGSGSVGIRRAAAQLDQLKDLSISLIDSKQKASGRVVINVVISKSKSDDYKIPPDFEVGTFTISKINAFNLKNTEFVGKQDPYVVLKFGDWTDKTHTKDEAGDNATWDFLSID